MCQHLAQAVRGKRSLCDRVLSLSCGFHMVAELLGAATAKVMSPLEQEETGEVFEEANGGQLEASELMAPITHECGRRPSTFFTTVCQVECNKQHLFLEGCSK